MSALLHTEFRPARPHPPDLSQAAFARIAGCTPRQVNNRARRSHRSTALGDRSRRGPAGDLAEATQIRLEDIAFMHKPSVPPKPRPAMARLALIYHTDQGGQPDLMRRVNAALPASSGQRLVTNPD